MDCKINLKVVFSVGKHKDLIFKNNTLNTKYDFYGFLNTM